MDQEKRGGKRKLTSDWLQTLNIRVSDDSVQSVFSSTDDKTRGERMVIHPGVFAKRSKFFASLDKMDNEMEFIVPGGMPIFSILVEFLYSGTLNDDMTEQTCPPLYYLAFKYDVPTLLELCLTWCKTNCFAKPTPITVIMRNEQKEDQEIKDDQDIIKWRRVNLRLIKFLRQVQRLPAVMQLFQHVVHVDNSVREELGLNLTQDASFSLFELAWLHLAIQIWHECHRSKPLILHGLEHKTTFDEIMGLVLEFLPLKQGFYLLKPLQQIETRKLALLTKDGDNQKTVYQLSRLAPMSNSARSFIAQCTRGHEMNQRLYPLLTLPSVTNSAAAALLTRLMSSSGIDTPPLDMTRLMPYFGDKIRITDALRLLSLSVKRLSNVPISANILESLKTTCLPEIESFLRLAILSAFVAAQLLLQWTSFEDVITEFTRFLLDDSFIWTQTKWMTIFLGALTLASDPKSTFHNVLDFSGKASLDHVNRHRYEEICVGILNGFKPHFHSSVRVELISFLCATIEFRRFLAHDESWSMLLFYQDQLREEKSFALIDQIIQGALKQHVGLRLESLKRCTSDELRLAILTSEDRENSLLSRESLSNPVTWFVGQVIDVSDVEYWRGKWCPCEILACRPEPDDSATIYIKYIGWSNYYNRWINTKTEASRIAPLGKHTTEKSLYGPERIPPVQPPNIPEAPPAVVVAVPIAVPNAHVAIVEPPTHI